MVLSIGMIVKNEADTLRDCLNGLKPLMEQVHSELIIADTGSTDGSVAIAKEFTDKVLQIDWKNDFAWARNHTVDRAMGQWYMYVDADEIFEDVSDIIRFFNSGEYRKYGSASHVLINKMGDLQSQRTMFEPLRLYKRTKRTRFTGAIHEYIPIQNPVKKLNSMCLHWGYYYKGEGGKEKKEKKTERNLPPLLEMYKNNPKNPRTITLIIQEYMKNNENREKVKEFVDTGLDLYKNKARDIYYHIFRKHLVGYYALCENYEQTVMAIRDYFDTAEKLYVSAVDLRVYEGIALFELGKYQESLTAYNQAMELRKRYVDGGLDGLMATMIPLIGSSPEIEETIKAGITRCNLKISLEKLEGLNFDDGYAQIKTIAEKSGIAEGEAYTVYAAAALNSGSVANAVTCYKMAVNRFGRDSVQRYGVIKAIEDGLTARQKSSFADAFAYGNFDETDDYFWLQLLRKAFYDGESIEAPMRHFIDKAAEKPGLFDALYSDVFVIALRRGFDFAPFADGMTVDALTKTAVKIVSSENDDADFFVYIQKSFEKNIKNRKISMKNARFMHMLTYFLFNKDADTDDYAGLADVFELYIAAFDTYQRMIYVGEVFTDELIDMLPDNGKLAYYAGKAYHCKESGDIAGFLSYMKTVMVIAPSLSGVVQAAAKKTEKREARRAEAPTDELAKEIAALKAVLITLIEHNEFDKASRVLGNYEIINPSDPDIARFRRMMVMPEETSND